MNDLVDEYLAKKKRMLAEAQPVGKEHVRVSGAAVDSMTPREQAGLWLVNFGAHAYDELMKLPRGFRRGLLKQWPGLDELLRKAGGDVS